MGGLRGLEDGEAESKIAFIVTSIMKPNTVCTNKN